MNQQDKKEFGAALSNALEVYGVRATATLIETWFDAVSEFDLEDIQAAFKRHVAGEEKAPVPKHIRKLAFREKETRQQFEARATKPVIAASSKQGGGAAGAIAALRKAGLRA